MKRFRQLLRYATVSAIATGISLTVLGILVYTRSLPYFRANLVATAVGTVPSFVLNRRWVWGRSGKPSLSSEIIPFALLTAAGLAMSSLTVVITGHWADNANLSDATRTLAVQAANLVGFGIVWLIQFVILDRWLFRKDAVAESPADASALVSGG